MELTDSNVAVLTSGDIISICFTDWREKTWGRKR